MTDMIAYLTEDELDCATDYGVPRSWVGENGTAVAVTSDRRRGLAAIHAMARVDLSGPASTSRVRTGWAQFLPGDGDPAEWSYWWCAEDAPGALPVVVAEELSEVDS